MDTTESIVGRTIILLSIREKNGPGRRNLKANLTKAYLTCTFYVCFVPVIFL